MDSQPDQSFLATLWAGRLETTNLESLHSIAWCFVLLHILVILVVFGEYFRKLRVLSRLKVEAQIAKDVVLGDGRRIRRQVRRPVRAVGVRQPVVSVRVEQHGLALICCELGAAGALHGELPVGRVAPGAALEHGEVGLVPGLGDRVSSANVRLARDASTERARLVTNAEYRVEITGTP